MAGLDSSQNTSIGKSCAFCRKSLSLSSSSSVPTFDIARSAFLQNSNPLPFWLLYKLYLAVIIQLPGSRRIKVPNTSTSSTHQSLPAHFQLPLVPLPLPNHKTL